MTRQEPDRCFHWYVLYTKARFEKKVNSLLQEKGLESYLPLTIKFNRWSDRWKKVEVPLFSCYVFVRITMKQSIYAVQTPGVIRIVSFNNSLAPVPDEEINSLKRIVEHGDEIEVTPYLAIDQTVEVVEGPFQGVRGRLIERRGQKRLLVGIKQIGQALTVEVSEWQVQPLGSTANVVA